MNVATYHIHETGQLIMRKQLKDTAEVKTSLIMSCMYEFDNVLVTFEQYCAIVEMFPASIVAQREPLRRPATFNINSVSVFLFLYFSFLFFRKLRTAVRKVEHQR